LLRAILFLFVLISISLASDKKLEIGEELYQKTCFYCHGTKGEGDGPATKSPPSSIFPVSLVKSILTEEQIYLFAKQGGKYWGRARDDMPSWKRRFSDDELRSIAKYVYVKIKNKDR
jgi:mono/diheme cytochrome c family protein